jgi:hypothetical protein
MDYKEAIVMRVLCTGLTFLFGSLLITIPVQAQIRDISIGDIQGDWNHDGTGENISIRGRNLFDSNYGAGRAIDTVEHAANFRFVYQGNIQCYYMITLTNNNTRMNLAPRNLSQSTSRCLRGTFNKAS